MIKEKGRNMYRKLKTGLSTFLAVMFLLSMLMAVPIPANAEPVTYVSVINPETGDGNFIYTNVEPPPTDANHPLGYVLANITVTDVTGLAGWAVNLTWDPTLLEIATPDDVYLPPDNIFAALSPFETAKLISDDNVVFGAAVGIGQPPFTGSGTMCQVKFNVTKQPAKGEKLFCDLVLDTVSTFPTELVDEYGEAIPFTAVNGYYEYLYVVPPLPKPYFEVYPSLVEMGTPMGPSIVGTPKAFFTIDILIDDLVSESMLVGLQFAFTYEHNGIFRLISDPETGYDATEGPFMKNPAWAPYGTLFFTSQFGEDETYGWFNLGIALWANESTHEYDWGVFPDTTGLSLEERVVCSITFEVIEQEQYPWEVTIEKAFDIEPLLGDYFYSATDEWIPYEEARDGDFYIVGWITGRIIDLYTQYPYPYGGQGLAMPSDMFWPQKEVELYANVTYNLWPVQAKIVTFEVRNPAGEIVTVLTAITDEYGVASTSYRIPWPCEDPESLFGVWTVTASVDIACEVVNDTLQFHFDYLVRWIEVSTDKHSYAHCEDVAITVRFQSHAMQTYPVLITVVIHDELNYPFGFNYLSTEVGGAEWCEYKTYEITFYKHVPKHAVAGIAKIYVNALSGLPTEGGCAWVPQYSPPPEIDIRPE